MDSLQDSKWDIWLRGRSAADLMTLLSLRPDVMVPPPNSFTVLATRLSQSRSYRRALPRLSRPALTSLAAIAQNMEPLPAFCTEDILHQLEQLALIFPLSTEDIAADISKDTAEGTAEDTATPATTEMPYALAPGLSTVLSQLPLDLSPLHPPHLRAARSIRSLLSEQPANVRSLLDSLANSGRHGESAALAKGENPHHPLLRLCELGLLHRDAASPIRVTLPEDVYRALRDAICEETSNPLLPPQPSAGGDGDAPAAPSQLSQRTATPQLARGTEAVALLLDALKKLILHLDTHPLPQLKNGGIGTRAFHSFAKKLDLDPDLAGIGLQSLACLGLIDESPSVEAWTTTTYASEFLAMSPPAQWAELVVAWWISHYEWYPHTDTPAIVLDPQDTDGLRPAQREHLFASLANWDADLTTTPGVTVTTGAVASLTYWRYPLVPTLHTERTLHRILTVATHLGLVWHNMLTPLGRLLATVGTDIDDADELHQQILDLCSTLYPEPVDSIIVQDDYTILVFGPLPPAENDLISRFTIVESPGLATVLRITEESLHEGFDSGLTASEILEFLKRMSTTPLPQALGYFVEEAARHHGSLRISPALSVLHSDDPALITAVATSSFTRDLGLRQLDSTVIVAQVPPRELLTALQKAGFSPSLEDSAGAIVNIHRQRLRLSPDSPFVTNRSEPLRSHEEQTQHLRLLAEQILTTAKNNTATGPEYRHEDIVPALREAISQHRTVVVGYHKSSGDLREMRLQPKQLADGRLEGVAAANQMTYQLPLHTIRYIR